MLLVLQQSVYTSLQSSSSNAWLTLTKAACVADQGGLQEAIQIECLMVLEVL